MLERMREILERIEEINRSFKAFAPRRLNVNKPTFQKALSNALGNTPSQQNTPDSNTISSNNNPIHHNQTNSSPLKNVFPNVQKPKSQLPFFQSVSPIALQELSKLQNNSQNNNIFNPSIYQDLINKYSNLYNLDPKLINRIIEVESNFNPNAVSKKGAMGLMQIMPETAKDLHVNNPFDPEQNIAAGTKYLSMLLKQYDGDLAKALAAYNAGPNTVNQYKGIPPFKETQDYIQKILSSIK